MSTFANTVSAFAQWQNLTRETRLRGPEDIVNDACKNTYLFGELMRGQDIARSVRGGTFISERIKVANQNNFAVHTPGQERNPSRTTTVQKINFPWAFYDNNVPRTDAEIELNEGDEYAKFKSMSMSLKQELETDHMDGLENLLFAVPNQGLMEAGSAGTGTQTPHICNSIPMFISEGSAAASTTGTVPPANNGSFTTIAGLSPTTYDKWTNAVEGYTTGALDNTTTGILAGFDKVYTRIQFRRPPGSKYYENDQMRKLKICTNKNGRTLYQALLRAANDQTRFGPQDAAYPDPQYNGFPVMYITALDEQLLEQNPIATYTTAVYPDGRPRYFFINCEYLFPVFHKNHFMEEIPSVNGGVRQYDTEVSYMRSWLNLVCISRRRQGILRPSA